MTERQAALEANRVFYQAFAAGDYATMERLWARGAFAVCIHPGWPVISTVIVVSLLGMRIVGMHYARELFASAAAWQKRSTSIDSQDSHPSERSGVSDLGSSGMPIPTTPRRAA